VEDILIDLQASVWFVVFLLLMLGLGISLNNPADGCEMDAAACELQAYIEQR